MDFSVPADVSRVRRECFKLMHSLNEAGRIDLFNSAGESNPLCSTAPLFENAGGQMFGIMICRDRTGSEVIIRAFSGQYNGLWEVEGWVLPIPDPVTFQRLVDQEDWKIKKLGYEISMLPEGKEKSDCISRRRELSRKLMAGIHSLYTLVNFAGESRSLIQVFSDYSGRRGVPAGTGDCCAPKLLNEAARRGITPVALSEFYWGRDSETRSHGTFYSPCIEKCRPVLGFMARGLGGIDGL